MNIAQLLDPFALRPHIEIEDKLARLHSRRGDVAHCRVVVRESQWCGRCGDPLLEQREKWGTPILFDP